MPKSSVKSVKSAKSNKANGSRPPIARSTSGIREALFDEFDALRNGTTTVQRCNAMSKLSSALLGTWQLEIEVSKLLNKGGVRPTFNAPKQIPPVGV